MGLIYQYTTWNENIYPHGEVKVVFSGRGIVEKANKVKIFSFPVDPHYLLVKGEKIKGILCEFIGEKECNFYAFFKKQNIKKLKVRVVFRGRIFDVVDFKKGVYRINLVWDERHIHSITLPSKYQIISVYPKGYKLSRTRNGVSLSWLWKNGYSGEIVIKFK